MRGWEDGSDDERIRGRMKGWEDGRMKGNMVWALVGRVVSCEMRSPRRNLAHAAHAAPHCLPLPPTASHCLPLPPTASHCLPLPFAH